MTNIGERIKRLRKESKLNQKDFSKSIGITQGALSEIENNNTKPSIDTIVAISEKFKISTNWLLTGKEIELNSTDDSLAEYIKLGKELKEKGFTPEDIKNLLKAIEIFYKKNNKQ